MTRSEKIIGELQQRVEDRDDALRAIGRMLTDERTPLKQRVDQAMGVVRLYECEPKIDTPEKGV